MTTTGTRRRPAAVRDRLEPATLVRRAGWAMPSIGVFLAGFVVYELFARLVGGPNAAILAAGA